MFSFGYVYNSNPTQPGYNQYGVVRTKAQAEREIKKKLAGKKVTFQTNENGQSRAFADGEATGYVYFAVKLETWVVLDTDNLGVKGRKAVAFSGDVEGCKEYLKKKYPDASLYFNRTGDNIEVENIGWDNVSLVKVG